MKTTVTKSVLIPTIPLLLGGFVYVLWRSPSLLMFRWFEALHLDSLVTPMRASCISSRDFLPDWFLYSLPDAAWASCGLLTFASIWAGSRSRARHVWIATPLILAVGGEFGQLFQFIPGTFDPADIVVCLFFGFLSLIVARRHLAYAI